MAVASSFSDHLSNPTHPLFVNLGENPALILVTPPLSDNNYEKWKHDMLVALETKNKERFVLGTLPCPPSDNALHEPWKRCNKMVISWLTCSMSLPIKQSIMWMDFAYEIWHDLLQRFSHGDKFYIADLQAIYLYWWCSSFVISLQAIYLYFPMVLLSGTLLGKIYN